MVWLGVCTKDVFPLVIFESDTLDHDRYIKEVLPVALKYSNDMCNDKKMEHVDVMMMFIDKLEGAAYRHPRY